VKTRLLLQPVDFCGEHEIAFGEAIDLVRENRDLYPAPGEKQIRMMPLLFRDGSGPIHEIESGTEIRKSKDPMQVVFIHYLPFGELRLQGV